MFKNGLAWDWLLIPEQHSRTSATTSPNLTPWLVGWKWWKLASANLTPQWHDTSDGAFKYWSENPDVSPNPCCRQRQNPPRTNAIFIYIYKIFPLSTVATCSIHSCTVKTWAHPIDYDMFEPYQLVTYPGFCPSRVGQTSRPSLNDFLTQGAASAASAGFASLCCGWCGGWRVFVSAATRVPRKRWTWWWRFILFLLD